MGEKRRKSQLLDGQRGRTPSLVKMERESPGIRNIKGKTPRSKGKNKETPTFEKSKNGTLSHLKVRGEKTSPWGHKQVDHNPSKILRGETQAPRRQRKVTPTFKKIKCRKPPLLKMTKGMKNQHWGRHREDPHDLGRWKGGLPAFRMMKGWDLQPLGEWRCGPLVLRRMKY